VSSRQLTTFSDFRLPNDHPDFLPTTEYCKYLERYCEHFQLWPHICLSTEVTSIRRGTEDGHIVSYKDSTGLLREWHCDAIAVCSGLHVTPNVPVIKGIDNVPVVMHSSAFKSRDDFGKNKQILILGSGETGMDIAHLAITSPTKSVVLSHRDGFLCAPKVRFPSIQCSNC
jgi:dimethylaniline monooxygenase (N-oxide forming)